MGKQYDETKLAQPIEKYNSQIPMLCWGGCHKETNQRVKTTMSLDIDGDDSYGEDTLWCPLCDTCLNEA